MIGTMDIWTLHSLNGPLIDRVYSYFVITDAHNPQYNVPEGAEVQPRLWGKGDGLLHLR
jgi:hypothetical protein